MSVMNQIKQIHAHKLRNGVDHAQDLVLNLLEIPNVPYAHKLFDLIPNPTVFLYNKLIKAYSSSNQHHECVSLGRKMRRRGLAPNEHSFMLLFPACAALSAPRLGQTTHSGLVKSGFEADAFVATALLDMYAKLGMLSSSRRAFSEMRVRGVPTWNAMIAGCAKLGDMEGALELFDSMPRRNVVSWTAMVSGYSRNGQYAEALSMFLAMEKERDVWPNEVTVASVLPACANLGASEAGERIEAYARRSGFFEDLYVSNAVLEMHARCGKIDAAKRVFDEIGERKNLCSWNSMIMGLAIHGRAREALALFDQMLVAGILPDDITFVGLISACTHGGMVAKGREFFSTMKSKFGIEPKLEHYGCLVDLLGRAGELREAYDAIRGMPMKADSVAWGSLLGACSFHGDVELAEKAAEWLFKLEPWNAANYVILSNVYASGGRWKRVARLRKAMRGAKVAKAAGYSCIEEGEQGRVHRFVAEDKSHPRSREIYALLGEFYAETNGYRNVMSWLIELEGMQF